MNTEVTKRVIPNLCGKIRVIPRTDTTLSKEGFSADAKVVGDKFAEHKLRIDNIDPHFAVNVGYDNTSSGLDADNVQAAIDKIADKQKVKTIGLWADINISSSKGICYQDGKVCTVAFDFTAVQDISKSGIPLYADLPTPIENFTFSTPFMSDGTQYWFQVTKSGHMTTGYVNDIPNGKRLFGTFTYIAE